MTTYANKLYEALALPLNVTEQPYRTAVEVAYRQSIEDMRMRQVCDRLQQELLTPLLEHLIGHAIPRMQSAALWVERRKKPSGRKSRRWSVRPRMRRTR